MKTIYIDSDFKCHMTDDGTLAAVETSAFDSKCNAYIEGCRFVPAGETWTREDGKEFKGEMAAPWMDYNILAAYQRQYESDQATLLSLQEKAAAYDILTGGTE